MFARVPQPEPALAADEGVSWAPGSWDGEPGPATRHARPVAFGSGLGGLGDGLGRGVADDPPTDPHGFPPIPAPAAASGLRRVAPERPRPAPDALEAAALAGAFAADYLSWDEDDRGRRGRALADHVAAPVGDPALLGWDGRGRQRAEFALPGLVRPDGDDRVLVDVRVRVTPYRKVGTADNRAAEADEVAEPEPDVLGVPAAAPAPTGRGWRGCASYWVRLSVPVVRDDGRLVVDAAEETADLTGGPPVGPGAGGAADQRADPDGAAVAYAEVRALREGLPSPVERAPRPTPEPESAW
jgi:hypothetical protein